MIVLPVNTHLVLTKHASHAWQECTPFQPRLAASTVALEVFLIQEQALARVALQDISTS